jgi:uroporphyrinogen-III synthase
MTRCDRTLLLIRPKAQSETFLAECQRQLGGPVAHVISPVLKIAPVNDLPDLSPYATVMVTSGNAVDRAGEQLLGRRVVTVGERTARRAAGFGANATCLGENIEQFLPSLPTLEQPVLHLRGQYARADMVGLAKAAGVHLDEAIVYEQREEKLNAQALELLSSGAALVPVFSPRTAMLASRYPTDSHTIVLAISDAAAKSWHGSGTIRVAEYPTADAVIELIRNAF